MATAVKEKPKAESLSLVEIKQKHEELFNSFFDGIIEQVQLNPESTEQITEYLKGSVEKRDSIVDVLFAVEAESERLRAVEKRVAERRRNYEQFCDGLRECIRVQMEGLGVKRVDGLVHRMLLREGKDRVEVTNIELLPPEYINYQPVADKNAISKDLHAGKEIPGAQLIPAQRAIVIT